MLKLIFCAFFFTGRLAAVAQIPDEIEKNISSNQYNPAKEQIDRFLSDPSNATNADAWYYKGKVYAELCKADVSDALSYDASAVALEAFKKYRELDKNDIKMILDQHVGLFQLYDADYNKGIAGYNAKKYLPAYKKFRAALDVEDYVISKGYSYNGFSFPVLDTQLLNLTGSSAFLAGMKETAIPYFIKLVSTGIGTPEFKEIYVLLGDYYQKKNDAVNARKYFDLGRKLYPGDDYWVSAEFGDPGTQPTARFKRYEEMMIKYPANYSLALDYATELFNDAYVYADKPPDYAARQKKLDAALVKVFAIQPGVMADYIMEEHINIRISDLYSELYALTKTPADEEKARSVNQRIDTEYELLKKYGEAGCLLYTAQPTLSDPEKNRYNNIMDNLIAYYRHKKDKAKVDFYLGEKAKLK